MRRVRPIVLAAASLLIGLDIVGALARQPLGFPYFPLSAVSLLLYLSVGLIGTWRGNFLMGVAAATVVGLLDGTLGPLAAWLMGPGPVGQTITEPRIFAYSIFVVTATAAGSGLIGAMAAASLQNLSGTSLLHGRGIFFRTRLGANRDSPANHS